eukprot:5036500-Prymnesium_polylepis.1
MSPLPGWLGGSQGVCLNMSNPDLAVQLHFALFNGVAEFVLKPDKMRNPSWTSGGQMMDSNDKGKLASSDNSTPADDYWPPPREYLQRASIEIISLHNLTKAYVQQAAPPKTFARLGERRPRFDGRRSDSHKYVPELSGLAAPPDNQNPSSVRISVSLHAIGGMQRSDRLAVGSSHSFCTTTPALSAPASTPSCPPPTPCR